LKKDSEQHKELSMEGDGVPGAPVTELEYLHSRVMPYSMRRIWWHIGKFGVVPRV